MSRSALTRFQQPSSTGNVSYEYPAPPPPPNGYFMPPVYPPGYPTITTLPVGMPAQPYVPIRLTGDEDDIEDPSNRKSVVPQHGNSQFNINPLLYQNIMENDYFKALYAIKTYHEVLDEVRAVVLHVAPWATGTSRIPSSAFCLLLKLLLMKMTFKQMNGILNNQDNVFIKAIGMLYLRYSCPPTDLWKWFEPHIEDDREITPSSDADLKMTIGSYAIKLLTDMSYFGTTLPRIPIPIERKIKVYLLLLEEKQKRRKSNRKYEDKGLLVSGLKIKAIYSDDENEPAWYEATIDGYDENSNKYLVTFPEYGNQSSVDLGDIELIDMVDDRRDTSRDIKRDTETSSSSRHRDRSRDRHSRSRSDSRGRDHKRRHDSRDRDRDRHRRRSPSSDRDDHRRDCGGSSTQNLMERVLQSSREASAAIGKNYGNRPASYKGSLSLKLDTYTARKKSPERSDRDRDRDRDRNRDRDRDRDRERHRSRSPANSSSRHHNSSSSLSNSTASKGISQDQLDRMKRLKETYGDASARSK